ncbi:MAG TPA: DUF721 domain-containing protein [Luteolibacter sp.]|nr:DUF721 domain-containing protein [Luteolibacter sp.]
MKRQPRPGAIRARILREWRGCDEALDLSRGVHTPGEFMQSILRAAGMQDGLHEDQVRAVWRELAGDFVASHAEPVSIRNRQLVLRVTQPSMRFHLEQMKPMLLERVRARLHEAQIESIKFTLG